MKKILVVLFGMSGLFACSTTHYDHCVDYTTSYSTLPFKPITYYQRDGNLLMQLPTTIDPDFVPEVQIMDKEFDQPYKIDSYFEESSSRLIVKDNYDEYILSRKSPDELTIDKIYVTCNRETTSYWMSDK